VVEVGVQIEVSYIGGREIAAVGDGMVDEDFRSSEVGSECGCGSLKVGVVTTYCTADASITILDFALGVVVGDHTAGRYISFQYAMHGLALCEELYEFSVGGLLPVWTFSWMVLQGAVFECLARCIDVTGC
jgi:hypothetical protein